MIFIKIRNIEEGKEILYVQYKDIFHYSKIHNKKIHEYIFNGNIIDFLIEKGNEFIRIPSKEEIKKFDEEDWIIDYREYLKKTLEELTEEFEILLAYSDRLSNEPISSSFDIQSAKDNEYTNVVYKMNSINEIRWSKKSNLRFKLPAVIDSESKPVIVEGIIFYHTLNPYIIKAKKEDGSPISKAEIPQTFINNLCKEILKKLNKISNSRETTYYKIVISHDNLTADIICDNKPLEKPKKKEKRVQRILNLIKKKK